MLRIKTVDSQTFCFRNFAGEPYRVHVDSRHTWKPNFVEIALGPPLAILRPAYILAMVM